MALYAYIKAPPGKGKTFIKKKKFFIKFKKGTPFLLVSGGLISISLVVYYIFSYKLLVLKKAKREIITPISEVTVAEIQGLINPLVAGAFTEEKNSAFKNEEIDYDLISNWFPTAPIPPIKPSQITHYTISIPKVKIKKAVVEIGGIQVKKSLIHYPGTALPGEFGNVVIFGHSVLPVFYNPQDYKSIFSLIPTLEKGDKIYVFFDGIEFIYEVVSYKEAKPEDVNVLEQRFDQQTLSLVTCVPPGTYLKRGIVKARLVGI